MRLPVPQPLATMLAFMAIGVSVSLAQDRTAIFQEWREESAIPGYELVYRLYKLGDRACGYYEEWANGRAYRHRFSGRRISPERLEVDYTCRAVFNGHVETCGSVFMDVEQWEANKFAFLVCDGRLKRVYGHDDCLQSKSSPGAKRGLSGWFDLPDAIGSEAWLTQCLTSATFPPIESRH